MSRRLLLVAGFVLALFIVAGFFVPVDKYTTNGCVDNEIPTVKLHMIKGESIAEIKKQDAIPPAINEGCSLRTNYELYIF